MGVELILEMAASGDPDRVGFGSLAGGLSYAEIARRARHAASRLVADGVEHLVYVGTSAPAFPTALFAGAYAGVPFIPLNYRLGREQLESLVRAHERVLVIADDPSLPALAAAERVVEREAWFAASDGDGGRDLLPADDDAVAVLLYTSGTTSAPKAAVLRHRHLQAYVLGSVEFASAAADEAALVSVPPYHIAGVATAITNVYAGRRVVYTQSSLAEAWLAAATDEGVTQAMVVPTMLARIVEHLDATGAPPPPRLRAVAYGGAPTPERVIVRALELFDGVGFVNAYGLTETSSTIAVLGPDDHRRAAAGDAVARERLRSAGRLLPGIEVEVRAEDGSALAPGSVGDLFVRGAQVSGEYLGHDAPDGTGGWFATRDRGWVDAEGYLFIEGRSDDTIIRGGENIAPAEIEDVLLRHPDVREVAVVGVPDDEWGQRVVAVVVPRSGDATDPVDLRAWAREHLRGSKTPSEVVLWDDLPHNDTGKLVRREIRTRLAAANGG